MGVKPGAPERRFTRVCSSLRHKHLTRLEWSAKDKHSSFVQNFVNYGFQSFITSVPEEGVTWLRDNLGKSYWRGRFSTVGLLELNCLDIHFHIEFFHKRSYFNEEVNCTELSPSFSIPWPIKNLKFSLCWNKLVCFQAC